MTVWGEHNPDAQRKPSFDEVLERFAAETGRPLWKVTRVLASSSQRARARGEKYAVRAAA